MYNVLIVEDDDEMARTLTESLSRYASEFGLDFNVTRCGNAVLFLKNRRTYDLVLMDIDLPGINGMEAATLLRSYDTQTPLIFVTNLAQYAVRGYEVDALDFIVKPISYYNFSMRMDKAVRVMRRNERSRLQVKTRTGIRILPLRDIVYIEMVNHDLVYHLAGDDPGDDNAEPMRVRGTLAKLEEEFEGGPFLRISKGCIVNMDHIRSIRDGMVHMSDGTTLYASRSRRRPALETFADYLGGSI